MDLPRAKKSQKQRYRSLYNIEGEATFFIWIEGATKAALALGAQAAGAAARHRWPNGIVPDGRFVFALTGKGKGCPTLFFDTGRTE